MSRIPFLLVVSACAVVAPHGPATASTCESAIRVTPPNSPPTWAAADAGCAAASRRLAGYDVQKGWDGKRRAAFATLLTAADAFARAVALHETDHGAAAEDGDTSAAEAAERHVFRRTLETLVADTAGRTAPVTFREADGALNAAYREVMAVETPRDLAWGSVEKAGIRTAERAWIAYRDAFLAFASTFDVPGVAERIGIELTMQRTARLEAFLAD